MNHNSYFLLKFDSASNEHTREILELNALYVLVKNGNEWRERTNENADSKTDRYFVCCFASCLASRIKEMGNTRRNFAK